MEAVADRPKSKSRLNEEFQAAKRNYLLVSDLYEVTCQNQGVAGYIRREEEAWDKLMEAKKALDESS